MDIPQIKPTTPVPVPSSLPTVAKKNKKPLFIVLGILVFLIIYLGISFLVIFTKAKSFSKTAQKLVTAVKTQDIPGIKQELGNTQKSLKGLKTTFKLVSWTSVIPWVGSYIGDAGHLLAAGDYGLDAAGIAIDTAEPYLAILGFGNDQQAEDGTKTTQERIDFVVNAIPDFIPKIDEISGKLTLAQKEIVEVNPDRYPVIFKGKKIRENLKKGISVFNDVVSFTGKSKPILESAPYLLGIDSPRTYLVLFQNDKELRPTGGFMTAYSIMKVDKGKFSPVSSSDIYNLDAKYKPTLAAPDILVKYLKGPYTLSPKFRLRDMNWSPDFGESMKLFTTEAAKVGITNVDGVISVDTQVLVYLLDAIGQIGVPGFGNFSTKIEPKCNCANVIYELESFADIEGPVVWDPAGTGKIIYAPPNYDNRKKIIGPLMNSILANAMGQPKDKLPKIFEAGFKSFMEKHVLFYLFDDQVQSAVANFGIAGTISDFAGDYLHINDSNLGGRKSNLYITQEVEQDIKVGKDGYIEKTVTITYKNPEKQDGWLNSVLPNWVRVYTPRGSQLISVEGLEDKTEPYEEFNKTVFAGFFKLRPEGVSKVILTYRLPFKAGKSYNLFIQKQPGTDAPQYVIRAGKTEEEFLLKTDKEIQIPHVF